MDGPFGLDTKAYRTIVADMEATLAPTRSRPGSLEAAVEGLLDLDYAGSG
ncbi:MAG: hypothetical protein IIA44_08070 [Acidobacteria bacterium]|nr:hypothetical protein [Acidobacteriota bacterium]